MNLKMDSTDSSVASMKKFQENFGETLGTLRSFRTAIATFNSRNQTSEWVETIMSGLCGFLGDKSPDVICESLHLLSACVCQLGKDLDGHLHCVASKLISCLGHTNAGVRCGAIHLLYAHLRITSDADRFFKTFSKHGMKFLEDPKFVGSLVCICTLFTIGLQISSVSSLITILSRQFETEKGENFYHIFYTLRVIENSLEGDNLSSFWDICTPEVHQLYDETATAFRPDKQSSFDETQWAIGDNLVFGIVTVSIYKNLTDLNENNRLLGAHALRSLMKSDAWCTSTLSPHFNCFLELLQTLMIDDLKKIQTVGYDIFKIVIERFNCELALHISLMVEIFSLCLSNHECRIRKLASSLVHMLMHYVHPMAVVLELQKRMLSGLYTLRIEILERITAALLSFPFYQFDFEVLYFTVSPYLEDYVLSVRQATVACLSTASRMMKKAGVPYHQQVAFLMDQCNVSPTIAKAITTKGRNSSFPSCTKRGFIGSEMSRMISTASTEIDFPSHMNVSKVGSQLSQSSNPLFIDGKTFKHSLS